MEKVLMVCGLKTSEIMELKRRYQVEGGSVDALHMWSESEAEIVVLKRQLEFGAYKIAGLEAKIRELVKP